MNITCVNNILTYTSQTDILSWALEYILFGSRSSIDYDVIVNVHPEMITLQPHKLLLICDELNKILIQNTSLSNKPINTCLGYWKDEDPHLQSNVGSHKYKLLWSQKGTIAETNNSIIMTFKHHPQIFESCPLTQLMLRDRKDVQLKIMAAIRMITSVFTSATTDYHITCNILNKIANVKEVEILDIPTRDRMLLILIKVYDLKTATYNKIKIILNENNVATLELESEMKNLILIRKKIVALRKKFNIDQYKCLYEESAKSINIIKCIVDNNKDILDKTLIEIFNDEMDGCTLTLRGVSRAALNAKYVCFQTDFLKCIDFMKIDLHNNAADKLKKIAFQIGQTCALLNGSELYEKESIAETYSVLSNVLFRKKLTDDDLNGLTNMLYQFVNDVYIFIERDFIELDMKD